MRGIRRFQFFTFFLILVEDNSDEVVKVVLRVEESIWGRDIPTV